MWVESKTFPHSIILNKYFFSKKGFYNLEILRNEKKVQSRIPSTPIFLAHLLFLNSEGHPPPRLGCNKSIFGFTKSASALAKNPHFCGYLIYRFRDGAVLHVHEVGRGKTCVEALDGEQVGIVPVVIHRSPLDQDVFVKQWIIFLGLPCCEIWTSMSTCNTLLNCCRDPDASFFSCILLHSAAMSANLPCFISRCILLITWVSG